MIEGHTRSATLVQLRLTLPSIEERRAHYPSARLNRNGGGMDRTSSQNRTQLVIYV
jgi:hypothetical protein